MNSVLVHCSGKQRPMNDTSTIFVINMLSSGYAALFTMLRVTVELSVAASAHASPS